MRDHNKLKAFQIADELALLTYKLTRSFPKDEIFGLTSQMRRASVSVPSNIVEGCARESQIEYRRFLDMAFGSLRELHYQFGLSYRLGYIEDQIVEIYDKKFVEAEKILGALVRTYYK